ncbi:MAG: hypothetical protein AAGE94_07595 [Acidobacteriota bacterium]
MSPSCRPFDDPTAVREPLLASEDFGRGHYDRALERSERFVMRAPCEAWSWRFKAECLLSLGRAAEAAACFDRALTYGGPGTEDTALWMAIAQHRAGDTAAAGATLRAFLASDPEASLADRARATLAELGLAAAA